MRPTAGPRLAGRLGAVVAGVVAAGTLLVPSMSWGDVGQPLSGEGGSFPGPLMNLLQNDPAAVSAISPFVPSYFDANIDVARQDFATGQTDYAVSELPLTSDQATAAAGIGRAFAYVPLAASPVDIAAVVECTLTHTLTSATMCPGIELTVPLLARIFTDLPSNGIGTWNNPDLVAQAPSLSGVTDASRNIKAIENVDPNITSLALETLFVDNPTTKPIWDTYLQLYAQTTDDTPMDLWPHTPSLVSGGDSALAQALVPENQNENPPLPFADPTSWGQGTVAAISPAWTGAPRNIPTVAIQNAEGAFVQPTTAAMNAALQDATMDPTTNLVTFDANPSDAAAYPIPVMSYLVVPTTGLAPTKATALAAFIRFVLGSTAAGEIESMGSVPPTRAMVAAGLHVADEVAAEATTTTTTTTTTTSTSSSTTSTTAPGTSPGSGVGGSSTTTTTALPTAENDAPSLAFTGGIPWPVPVTGAALAFAGLTMRRVVRFRLARRVPTS